MLTQYKIEDILFLDIETVSAYPSYHHLTEQEKSLWDRKSKLIVRDDTDAEGLYSRAGIYAEFGRVLCICVGKLSFDSGSYNLKLRSFYNDDEKCLLQEFSSFLSRLNDQIILCAHNGKEFDFPYLCRRMLVNQVELPPVLDLSGRKPWEIKHLDTLEMWKFGDYKHYTSLELLANVFGIPTPKDDINGSDIHEVYYDQNDISRIVDYCFKDVVTITQLMLKFKNQEAVQAENIYYV